VAQFFRSFQSGTQLFAGVLWCLRVLDVARQTMRRSAKGLGRREKIKHHLILCLVSIAFLFLCARATCTNWAFVGNRETLVQPAVRNFAEGRSTGAERAQDLWQSQNLWKAVSFFNAACWGSSYVATKAGMNALQAAGVEDPITVFQVLRFSVAALPLLPWLLRSTSTTSASLSAVTGVLVGMSYLILSEAYALGTTASKAAFITSLQTIVVAACCCLEAGTVQIGLVISSLLAVIGVGCLELQGINSLHLEMTKGDVLCLGCPLFTGLAWFVLGKQMKRFPKDVMASMAVQLTIFAVLFMTLLLGELLPKDGVIGIFNWCSQLPQLLQNPGVLGPLIFSVVFGSWMTTFLSNRAIRVLSSSDVSLIITSEPLWAALAAMSLLKEILGWGDFIGIIFIMAALLCNELWGKGSQKSQVCRLTTTQRSSQARRDEMQDLMGAPKIP